MLKIHLGCNTKKLHGFINVDADSYCHPDVVDNIVDLNSFEENTIDLIYTCHTFEHLRPDEAELALARWTKLLKPDGILRISVPDFAAIVKRYIYTDDIKPLQRLLHGSLKNQWQLHYVSYDYKSLSNLLNQAGLVDIKRYDPFAVEETKHIDDLSRAYLPHMDFNGGLLMSLNVEARKP